MSSTDLLRGFFAFVFGAALAWGLYKKYDPSFEDEDSLRPDRHWAPMVMPWVLPLFLMMLLALMLATDAAEGLPLLGAMCIGIFLHMSVYYVLLLAAGPLLRRWVSARACAVLWLLPNFLYICQMNYMRRSAPRRVLRLQGSWLRPAVILWLAGAAAVLLWKFTEHFCFRRKLKVSARPETDEETVELWADMQRRAGMKKPRLRLLRSGLVTTPLSVGLFPGTTFVVLPEKEYTPAERRLILRHELIHILRRDAQAKLFLTFCAAVCWFNPLLWAAIRRCAEDLELSCDELVLEDEDETEKKRYAELILGSVGETKGFTSSLAPKAASLRYRLKQIMNPGRRLTGGITAGLLLFLLLVTDGSTAVAFGGGSMAEQVFPDDMPAAAGFSEVELGTRNESGGMRLFPGTCTDPDALLDYLSGLRVFRMSGNYELAGEGNFMEVFLPGDGGMRILTLEEHCLKLVDLGKKPVIASLWYLEESPDWDYVRSLVVQREPENAVLPQPPDMEIVFGTETGIDADMFTAAGKVLENTLDGEPSEHYAGWQEAPCAVEGVPLEWADIRFTIGIPPESLYVTAWNPEHTESRSIEIDGNGLIQLLPESACYTVEARWEYGTDEGMQVYRMEYRFDVVLPETE